MTRDKLSTGTKNIIQWEIWKYGIIKIVFGEGNYMNAVCLKIVFSK